MGTLFFDYGNYKRNLPTFPFCNAILWSLSNYVPYNIIYVGFQAKQRINDMDTICTFMSSTHFIILAIHFIVAT